MCLLKIITGEYPLTFLVVEIKKKKNYEYMWESERLSYLLKKLLCTLLLNSSRSRPQLAGFMVQP